MIRKLFSFINVVSFLYAISGLCHKCCDFAIKAHQCIREPPVHKICYVFLEVALLVGYLYGECGRFHLGPPDGVLVMDLEILGLLSSLKNISLETYGPFIFQLVINPVSL